MQPEQGTARIVVRVEEHVFCQEAVERAAYWFTDHYHLDIRRDAPGILVVSFDPKAKDYSTKDIEPEFRDALIDAQLRIRIAQETKDIRNVIVAKAFAEGNLLDDAPVSDWRDPVAINQNESANPEPHLKR